MLKFPCLILDHDDTVVQSEATINYPYFVYILDQFRPGRTITLDEYVHGCCSLGFAEMCRQWYHFTEEEMAQEYAGWKAYIRTHIPDPYPGIAHLIHRYQASGGKICVVSHSGVENISRDYRVHFGIQPDAIYGWDLPEHQRKPSTFPLEDIMRRYHFRPEELLVVDDMKPACEMASNSGVPIAFAAWGREAYPQILAEMTSLCDYTFHDVSQLEAFLFSEI